MGHRNRNQTYGRDTDPRRYDNEHRRVLREGYPSDFSPSGFEIGSTFRNDENYFGGGGGQGYESGYVDHDYDLSSSRGPYRRSLGGYDRVSEQDLNADHGNYARHSAWRTTNYGRGDRHDAYDRYSPQNYDRRFENYGERYPSSERGYAAPYGDHRRGFGIGRVMRSHHGSVTKRQSTGGSSMPRMRENIAAAGQRATHVQMTASETMLTTV